MPVLLFSLRCSETHYVGLTQNSISYSRADFTIIDYKPGYLVTLNLSPENNTSHFYFYCWLTLSFFRGCFMPTTNAFAGITGSIY